jgi:cation transport ATPase
VNEVGKRENSPSTIINSIRNEQKRMRKEVRVALDTGTSIKKLHETQFKESINILFSNLYLTYICYIRNITENISGPDLWNFYADKLPKQSFMYKLLPLLFSFNNFLLKVIYVVILIFVCGLPWFRKLYKDDLLKHHFYTSLALILTYLYFALISGITFWTGPRMLYPAEFALFILSVIIGHCFFYFISSIFNQLKKA